MPMTDEDIAIITGWQAMSRVSIAVRMVNHDAEDAELMVAQTLWANLMTPKERVRCNWSGYGGRGKAAPISTLVEPEDKWTKVHAWVDGGAT